MDRREFLVGSVGAAVAHTSSSWAKSGNSREQRIIVGDSRLQVELHYGPNGVQESDFQIEGKSLASLTGESWSVILDGKDPGSRGAHTRLAAADGQDPARNALFEGELPNLAWTLKYEVTGFGRITKSLSVTPKRDGVLQHVSLWNVRSDKEPLVARTKLQDIAAFYRQGSHGMFISLDFPYSQISSDKGITEVSYPPFDQVRRGQTYSCHSLTIGGVQLTGVERYGYDVGEVNAFDTYVQQRYKPRFERPMFVSASINNRYTQVRNGVVFYTMKDQPTLNFNVDLLKRELAMMPKLGIEYYQVFPGVFDWGPDDPSPQAVQMLMDYARSLGIRMGGYSEASRLFVAHYNEYRNTLDRLEWQMQDKDGKALQGTFCFGVPDYVEYHLDVVVRNCKTFGSEIHCLDGLHLAPCYAANHAHPAGPDGCYHQIRGLVRLLEAIDNVSPQMMSWSNAGTWRELLPKLAWSNHNLYLTDPFIRTPWQGINMTRLLDDARREQMVSLHYTSFIPYRFYCNCQYFFCQNSLSPDVRNFKYGALSTIAVTPNLTFGEVREWIDQLPGKKQEEVIYFYKKWTDFLKDNYELWKHTYHVGENPGVGSVEIYSHAEGKHGFIFIVNPQYWGRVVEVPLDASLGFAGTDECEIVELYPTERLRLTAEGPFVKLGARVPIHVPAQEVLVLEVRPAPEIVNEARLYGLPGSIETAGEGFRIKTYGPQGSTARFAVLVPPDNEAIESAHVLPNIPKQPKRHWAPTSLTMLGTINHGALMEMTFRRKAAPTELTEWQTRPGALDEGVNGQWHKGFTVGRKLKFPLLIDAQDVELPLSDELADKLGLGLLSNFCGAYIDNAFSEVQETWIDLKKGVSLLSKGPIGNEDKLPERRSLDPLATDQGKEWWLQTEFYLPFINTGGTTPPFEEHPRLVLPVLRQNSSMSFHAWINGIALKVEQYHYPRNPKLECYYADLIGSGARGQQQNSLVLQVQS